MKKTFLPLLFKEKYSKIMGTEADRFFEYCQKKIPKSIWINSLKTPPQKMKEQLETDGWELKELFHKNAFSIEGIPRPGNHPAFRDGLFNLQEKASMIPALALNPKKADRVLDATAAPGNKTLQLSCLMDGKGKIIATEKNVTRFRSLRYNVNKFGMKNVTFERMNVLELQPQKLFDKILLDAPCSSEGVVRKRRNALFHWSPKLVKEKAAIQKELLEKCVSYLKKGGEIVYSTCSLSPEENESVVQSVLEKGRVELVPIILKQFATREGMEAYEKQQFDTEMRRALRIYPQDNDCQAFFVAKMKKVQ
jgi:tRNA (cytosine49-C5)-methyltransferase